MNIFTYNTRGSILASTLVLFGLTLLLTSIILSLSTHRLRQTASRDVITRASDLTASAIAWLEWRLRTNDIATAFPIETPVQPSDAAWTLTAESADPCSGSHTLRLESDGKNAVKRILVRETPITNDAIRLTGDAFSPPNGTTVEGSAKNWTPSDGTGQPFLSSEMDPWPSAHPNLFTMDATTRGYHFRLNGGTLLVSRVTKTEARWSYDDESKWSNREETIREEKLLRSITLDSAPCSPKNFFLVDGPTWVDGSTNRSLTIFTLGPGYPLDPPHPIIINGNITKEPGGRIGLIVDGGDIIIPLHAPEDLTIHAAMDIGSGSLIRRHYCAQGAITAPGAHCNKTYANDIMRQKLTIFGSIVSRAAPKWNWFELGKQVSGYRTAEIIHDTSLIDAPPPYFPRHRAPYIITPIE